MSHWTYVDGYVKVDVPGCSQPQIQYILDTTLEHLPCVTGSENNMNLHTVKAAGHISSSTHNEFGEPMCCRPGASQYDWFETQSIFYIVLDGHFRDREFQQTFRELVKWLTRLSKRLQVEDLLIKLKAQDRTFIISDPEPYSNMFEFPSWSSFENNEDKESAWWEYLMPDTIPGTLGYPLKLYAKYYADKEVDDELQRRHNWETSFDKD